MSIVNFEDQQKSKLNAQTFYTVLCSRSEDRASQPNLGFVVVHDDSDEKLFHKEYWNNHRDKPSGSYNAPKTFRQFKNQQFRREYVQYIHRLINNKNELSNIESKHKKNINWEWW